MSEYQYYEFLAVDRPLDEDDMRALRALSSRARITATSFVNHYDWGDFKGNPDELVERHFDLFLYFADWGTRSFVLRVPRRFLDPELALRYCAGEGGATARTTAEHVILEFQGGDEGGGWSDPEDDGRGWLAALVPLRSDLMRGDLRCLYLGWLLSADQGWSDDDAEEPPVPAGLDRLSAPLEAFADFLLIDPDLLAVAAEGGGELASAAPSRGDIEAFVRELPEDEKEALLLRVVDDDPHVGLELQRRVREAATIASEPAPARRRTAGQLLAAAEARAEARRRQEAEREAAEQKRRERERAALRARYLDDLAEREAEAWQRVDALIAGRKPTDYDRAAELLTDLRDMSERSGRRGEFDRHARRLREKHARKMALLQRLDAVQASP